MLPELAAHRHPERRRQRLTMRRHRLPPRRLPRTVLPSRRGGAASQPVAFTCLTPFFSSVPVRMSSRRLLAAAVRAATLDMSAPFATPYIR